LGSRAFYSRDAVGIKAERFGVIQRCFNAFNNRDVQKWLELFHPDVEFIPLPSHLTPAGTTYHGREGMITWAEGAFAQKARVSVESHRGLRDLGDRVLVTFSVFTDGDRASVTGTAIYTFKDGKISRAEGFATEAEALAAQQQQNNQFRVLFEHTSDAIVLLDDNGHFIDANLVACDLYGLSVEQLRSRTIFDFIPPELVGELEELSRDLRVRSQLSGDLEIVSSRGEHHPVEMRARAHFIPGRHLILLMNQSQTLGLGMIERSRESRLDTAARRLLDERGSLAGAGSAAQPEHPRLTARELEVLQQAAEGRSTREIAEVLFLSAGTVKTHFHHIYEKLGARDRTAAVAECLRRGLIK
jgi:PAS domain S-box-containing protein